MTEEILKSLERSSLALISTDSRGRVRYSNERAVQLFGSLEGITLADPPPIDDPRGPLANLVAVWEGLEDRSVPAPPRIVRVKAAGLSSFLWFHCVPQGEGTGAGTLFLVADLTAHLAGSEPVQRLISQLAHDLRSPLTSIAGAAELLLSGRVGSLPGVQEKLVKIVDDGATRMTSIIQHAAEEGSEKGVQA